MALGGECVFASEIDIDAQKAYAANYNLPPMAILPKYAIAKFPTMIFCLRVFPVSLFLLLAR